MKNFAFLLLFFLITFLPISAFADGEEPVEEAVVVAEELLVIQDAVQISAIEDELVLQLLEQIQALTAQVEVLSSELVLLRTEQAHETIFSIGVMPVEGAEKISGIGGSFRVMLVSALNDAGINAVESMDEELLHWVQRQDELVRNGWIDPVTAPRPGHLRGVNYYLLTTVTSCDVTERDEEWGPFTVEISNVRTRHASLRIDLRLIDVYSGVIVDSFPIAATAEERTGPVLFDNSYDPREIEVIVTEKALEQMVLRVVEFFSEESL